MRLGSALDASGGDILRQEMGVLALPALFCPQISLPEALGRLRPSPLFTVSQPWFDHLVAAVQAGTPMAVTEDGALSLVMGGRA